MGQSVLVFVSHSSEDKDSLIEPLVADLESCYINVWLDKKKIIPGDNLRKSIFRDGLDKADVALIFFTEKSLESRWVDREIKHVLREETKKGNNFDLNKIISIFDSKETYDKIAERYPELTDDLLHLMPTNYSKVDLGKLISAIWSKYLSLQGGDIEVQRQMLAKDKEIFQKDIEIQELKIQLNQIINNNSQSALYEEFNSYVKSGIINEFINQGGLILGGYESSYNVPNFAAAVALGLAENNKSNPAIASITEKGKQFFRWYLFEKEKQILPTDDTPPA